MVFYHDRWIHQNITEAEVLQLVSWENEQGKCTVKSMVNQNTLGLKTDLFQRMYKHAKL